jgi:hypothetical protein
VELKRIYKSLAGDGEGEEYKIAGSLLGTTRVMRMGVKSSSICKRRKFPPIPRLLFPS